MTNPLVDGLGGEEVETGSMAGLGTQNMWVNGNIQAVGSITTASHVIASQSIGVTGSVISSAKVEGQSITATGSIVAPRNIVLGSSLEVPVSLNNGVIINTITANANISGGMWVTGSSVSGTNLSLVCKPLATGVGRGALGICIAYTASGTASYPSILTRGLYKGLVAEGTVNAGDMIAPGVGAALNTAIAAAGGSGRGYAVMGAGSEGTCAVWLW